MKLDSKRFPTIVTDKVDVFHFLGFDGSVMLIDVRTKAIVLRPPLDKNRHAAIGELPEGAMAISHDRALTLRRTLASASAATIGRSSRKAQVAAVVNNRANVRIAGQHGFADQAVTGAECLLEVPTGRRSDIRPKPH